MESWATRLADDPRWRRLQARGIDCKTCGQLHKGLFDLACARPEQWSGGEERVPNSAALTSRHFLSEDLCVLDGEHYFVRCVLELPIIGAPGERFGYGTWSTLSKSNFELFLESFDAGEQDHLGPWFGWFSNRLKGYPDTLNLRCQVLPQSGRQRPRIELESVDHPLAVEQRHGVTFDRLLEIYALNG